MPADPTDEFTCAACGGTFPKGWSDHEALAEMVDTFGTVDPADRELVCDHCYRRMGFG